MIKPETIGYLDVAKLNSAIVSDSDVTNYSFLKKYDTTYLIMNESLGHDSYADSAVISAGEFLNGYQVDSLAGMRLIVDMKHIGTDTIKVGDVLVITQLGNLEVDDPVVGEPYFVVEEKTYLTMPAVKVRVYVKYATASAGGSEEGQPGGSGEGQTS